MRGGWMVVTRRRLDSLAVLTLMALAVMLGSCRISPLASMRLEGTEWVLVTVAGKPPLTGAPVSAAFSAEQISGSTGCNRYLGEYAASRGDITIGDLARTERYCTDPVGVMDQEEAVLDALISAAGYRVSGTRLELLDADDNVVLAFGPAAAVPES